MNYRMLALAAVVVTATSCERDAPFGPLPPGQATINVQAYYDYDGQPGPGGPDQPAPGLRFQVVLPGSATAVREGVADAMGLMTLDMIPVGTYELRVEPAFLGDSLVLSAIDTTRVTLAPNDVLGVAVGVTPPTRTIDEARQLPEGRRVWVEGLALNNRASSADQSIHLLGGDGRALRASFPSAVPGSAGDSLRVLGRTMGSGSRRALAGSQLLVLAQSVRPVVPLEIDAADVASAGGGELDARLVVVRDGVVVDTSSVPFVGTTITVEVGEASFDALLLGGNGFGAPIVPDTPVLSMTGLLVPDPGAGDRWRLVPRSGGDVQFGTPPPGG